MRQNWYKSWALWVSIAALIAYVVKSVWGKDIAPWLNGLMDVLLPVLVGFGIVNNPNCSDAWVLPSDKPTLTVFTHGADEEGEEDEYDNVDE